MLACGTLDGLKSYHDQALNALKSGFMVVVVVVMEFV